MTGSKCIISMCDIQITTGFAILISGFIMAQPSSAEPLNAWHWEIVVSLAWFSTITHLAGLSVFRRHTSERPWIQWIRLVSMVSLGVALMVAYIPTGFFNWSASLYGGPDKTCATQMSPAICYFSIRRGLILWNRARLSIQGLYTNYTAFAIGTTAMEAMILRIVFLVFGLVTRVAKLFPFIPTALGLYIRRPLRSFGVKLICTISNIPSSVNKARWPRNLYSQTPPPTLALYFDLVITPLLAFFLGIRIHLDVFSSMLFEVRRQLFTSKMTYAYIALSHRSSLRCTSFFGAQQPSSTPLI